MFCHTFLRQLEDPVKVQERSNMPDKYVKTYNMATLNYTHKHTLLSWIEAGGNRNLLPEKNSEVRNPHFFSSQVTYALKKTPERETFSENSELSESLKLSVPSLRWWKLVQGRRQSPHFLKIYDSARTDCLSSFSSLRNIYTRAVAWRTKSVI